MLKNRDEYRFVVFIIIFALFITGLCFLVEHYKSSFSIADWSVVSTIMQGTLGVAVSFAGAIVAIKLARLSTLIIEKEKSREDSKFYNEIITEALGPLKQLSFSLEDLYHGSMKYAPELRVPTYGERKRPLPPADLAELVKLKHFMATQLKQLILALEGIHNSSFAYALWLHVINHRKLQKGMIERGGSAGFTVNYGGYEDNEQSQGGYLIEDLLHVTNRLKMTVTLIDEMELTDEDVETIKQINAEFPYYAARASSANELIDTNSLFFRERQTFFSILTLVSLIFNNAFKTRSLGFYNRFFFLLADLANNFPNKDLLVSFMLEVAASDKEVVEAFPQVRTFDMLKDAFWLTFPLTNALRDYPPQELAVDTQSEQTDELAKKWYLDKWGIS